MKKHVNFLVKGKVQGVGFRFSCTEKANKFKIFGFVTNRKDGNVYVEAEGTEQNLFRFKEWLLKGPAWARVHEVEEEQGPLKDYDSFEIVR
jgi:acylphosphatase